MTARISTDMTYSSSVDSSSLVGEKVAKNNMAARSCSMRTRRVASTEYYYRAYTSQQTVD